MFGFGKKAKVSSAVGRSLHRQMRRALEHDQEKSNERMLSTFTAGYLMGYTQSCYSLEGFDSTEESVTVEKMIPGYSHWYDRRTKSEYPSTDKRFFARMCYDLNP